MKRVLVIAVMLALAGEGLAAATPPQVLPLTLGSAVEQAAKKRAPRVTVTAATTRSLTSPYPLKLTVRKPVLHGSTAKNRKAFANAVNRQVRERREALGSHRKHECGESGPAGELVVTHVDTDVYKGRYASFTLRFWSSLGCPSNYPIERVSSSSFTLDLKTGKRMKLSRFAAKDISTHLATISRLYATHSSCLGGTELRPPGTSPHPYAWSESSVELDASSAWSVGKSGLRLTYSWNHGPLSYCRNASVVVPWSRVARPKQIKGAKSHQVFVNDLRMVKGEVVSGMVAIVTTRGRKVTLGSAGIEADIDGCAMGIRRGAKAHMFGEVAANPWTLKFSSKSKGARAKLGAPYKRATKAQRRAIAKYTAQFSGKLDAANYCFS